MKINLLTLSTAISVLIASVNNLVLARQMSLCSNITNSEIRQNRILGKTFTSYKPIFVKAKSILVINITPQTYSLLKIHNCSSNYNAQVDISWGSSQKKFMEIPANTLKGEEIDENFNGSKLIIANVSPLPAEISVVYISIN